MAGALLLNKFLDSLFSLFSYFSCLQFTEEYAKTLCNLIALNTLLAHLTCLLLFATHSSAQAISASGVATIAHLIAYGAIEVTQSKAMVRQAQAMQCLGQLGLFKCFI